VGWGKTEREIADGLDAGVLLLNVESEDELRIVDRLARERDIVAPVAIRVNPEITVETPHSYIRTGEKGHKFGIPYDEVREVARVAGSLPNVVLRGLDMHVGSQLSRLDAYRHESTAFSSCSISFGPMAPISSGTSTSAAASPSRTTPRNRPTSSAMQKSSYRPCARPGWS
jgi:diaminopimelate decarboxylase